VTAAYEAERIANGEMDRKIDYKSLDEVGVLIKAINRLAYSLKHAMRILEGKAVE
jgi:HAMP domain-containing protein